VIAAMTLRCGSAGVAIETACIDAAAHGPAPFVRAIPNSARPSPFRSDGHGGPTSPWKSLALTCDDLTCYFRSRIEILTAEANGTTKSRLPYSF
jgi:hypothetical protein